MNDIKYIVFDFGGVLIDWNPLYLYQNKFKEKSELDFFLTEVCNHEWNEKQDAGRSFKDGVAELVVKYPQYRNEIELFETNWLDMVGGEIRENTLLIDKLSPQYRLFGLTNWSTETFALIYDSYSFFKKLETIVISGEEKLLKPAPEIYKRLLDKCRIEAKHTLFIDDNEQNIESAQKLGFSTIHFKEGMKLEEEMKKKGIDFVV